MEAAQLSFLVVLASLLLAIDQALGCMCKNEHPQQLVCRADFGKWYKCDFYFIKAAINIYIYILKFLC